MQAQHLKQGNYYSNFYPSVCISSFNSVQDFLEVFIFLDGDCGGGALAVWFGKYRSIEIAVYSHCDDFNGGSRRIVPIRCLYTDLCSFLRHLRSEI